MAEPALLLGAAVVKTACKVWLKDNAFAADAAVTLVDIVKAKVSDAREQRRVRNLFEDLEERVADNVTAGLTAEFGDLPDNERAAAVLAVRDTFDRAKPSAAAVFATNLTAAGLERLLRPFGRTATLSADATALYDRVLRDCCAYVVEVANVLPGFETGVFREILTRQHEIMRRIDERFDLLPMQLGGAGAETFEPKYLRLAASRLDKVELFGVTVSDHIEDYPLSVAYVSLSLRSSAEEARRVTSIGDGLGPVTRAFIRSEAGSGKTTLLQWLAVRAARREFDGPMADWNGCVPLFIRLRRYSGGRLPDPQDFLQDVGGMIAGTMPLGWVNGVLDSGRALVLIDGVDELPESQRRDARDWLRNLVDAYPRARYVVTSRPTAAAESWLAGESFTSLEIQPMTVADIEAFINHWHAAMAVAGKETDRIESSRVALTEAVRTRRHLRVLAVNPLMTALICALHLDRRMQLPDDRMELYRIALDMLLERRDTERRINASAVTMPRADKLLILQDLAYWLVRNGWSVASRERVEERLAAKLANMHRVKAGADEVLRYLLERTGLLRMPAAGQIDFVHKTFQEYLAARAAAEADDIGLLVRHAHDDQWREVVLMAAGHARPRQTEDLLRKLLERADEDPGEQYVLRVLAVGAIQHAPQLPPDLRTQLNDIAEDLLPPRDPEEADALAAAGELVLELLPTRDHYSLSETRATVRMAAAIGGEHALSIIAQRVTGVPTDVLLRSELASAWSRFDPVDFASRVLAGTPFSEYVSVVDPSALVGLQHVQPVSLRCDFRHGHGDVDYLTDLWRLRWFFLSDATLRDVSAIAGHSTLETLRLGMLDDVNLAPIGQCRSLRSLILPRLKRLDHVGLGKIGQITSLSVGGVPADLLRSLASELRLKKLDLLVDDYRGFADLMAAPQLSKLERLELSVVPGVESIAGIDLLPDTVTWLRLHAPDLADVSPLAGLSQLRYANLRDTPIESLGFAVELTKLEILNLGGVDIENPDLSPLCDLPALRTLDFPDTDIVDLSGLAGTTNDLEVHVVGSRSTMVYGMDTLPSSVEVVFDL